MVQQVKQQFGCPHSISECLGLSPACVSDPASYYIVPERQPMMTQVLGFLPPLWETHGKPGSWLQTGPELAIASIWGSEPADETSLSLSFYLSSKF